MKRNKPQCDRLGNIYDACQWMLRFTLINSTETSIRSFCSFAMIFLHIKINKIVRLRKIMNKFDFCIFVLFTFCKIVLYYSKCI